MNFDMKSGAEAHALHTLRAVLCGLEHREVPPPRESAAVYHRFRFMAPVQFKMKAQASNEPWPGEASACLSAGRTQVLASQGSQPQCVLRKSLRSL